jgi:hypothetical protein
MVESQNLKKEDQTVKQWKTLWQYEILAKNSF